MKLYTIGHGNLDLDSLIQLLRDNDVRWVADVRSAPYSRMFPWFNKAELARALDSGGGGARADDLRFDGGDRGARAQREREPEGAAKGHKASGTSGSAAVSIRHAK